MIFEALINILCELIIGAMSAFNMVTLPVNLIQALGAFCSYGAYIVGADLLLIFCSCVFMWMTIKGVLGLILFIWRLLPLT